jgi:hypothetical protein
MTFSTGWCLQLGLKGPPARSARPWSRGEPLVSGYVQPGLNVGGGALVPIL